MSVRHIAESVLTGGGEKPSVPHAMGISPANHALAAAQHVPHSVDRARWRTGNRTPDTRRAGPADIRMSVLANFTVKIPLDGDPNGKANHCYPICGAVWEVCCAYFALLKGFCNTLTIVSLCVANVIDTFLPLPRREIS